MSRLKQYKIKKQQKLKLKKKSYKVESKVAELLLSGNTEEALKIAKEFLIKHPTNIRGWAYKKGVELWIKHIEPRISKYPIEIRLQVLKVLRQEWKNNPQLKEEIVLPKINAFIPS
ncbi:MAG: hypothetical protein ABIL37_03945 [candidate division WOR-3 bacterium]